MYYTISVHDRIDAASTLSCLSLSSSRFSAAHYTTPSHNTPSSLAEKPHGSSLHFFPFGGAHQEVVLQRELVVGGAHHHAVCMMPTHSLPCRSMENKGCRFVDSIPSAKGHRKYRTGAV